MKRTRICFILGRRVVVFIKGWLKRSHPPVSVSPERIPMGRHQGMTVVSAHDVADEIRRRLPGIGVVKLHKILYYVQGWHLVWTGEPIFHEGIEAWANGPVVKTLWADEKHDRGRPEASSLDDTQLAIVDYVVGRYGGFSGKELIRRTHLEDPWRDVSESEDPWSMLDPEIGHDALVRWFQQDDDAMAYEKEVERLRGRSDIHSFRDFKITEDLESAIDRARQGERVRHTRPT